MVDPEALAVHIGVPVGTIYRWAHEDGWQKFGRDRRRLYRIADAEASADKRGRDWG
ncbi:hypothetical protein LQ327_08875 [Actinomycetospora endophytica]|uniref:Helix-turn-helix protein n=1 Tax=Actinomycetospora endophytica TaxID=2291215 RepID=A0ABS8P8Y9_9PSEU|nr:hypothetical protein [Actinomycetospora endophytica]MCD2193494.1 hypothetical protein [Actinomycetospora endophytica]